MQEMNIEYLNLSEIKPYENNPRNNDEAVDYVANSIKEFGFKVPIIIDKNNVIVAGHTRLKAAEKLGLEKAPCIRADDLTENQIKAFRLADNKVGEIATWDLEKLNIELENINFDMSEFGFEIDIDEIEIKEEKENPYTKKVDVPQYKMTGECPYLSELCDTSKVEELKILVNSSKVTAEQKEFLNAAITRFYKFDFQNIAEYYAHQNSEMQELMEKLALVIIDFDDAIKNGYVALSNSIDEMLEEDSANDEA